MPKAWPERKLKPEHHRPKVDLILVGLGHPGSGLAQLKLHSKEEQ